MSVSSSVISIIKKIKDSEVAKLRLTGRNGEPVHLDCIYKEAESPNFFLVFPPKTIPDDLEMSQECTVAINSQDDSLVLTADIESRQGDRTLEMTGKEIIDPVSLREYFRVLYRTTVTASFEPTSVDSNTRSWKLEGSSVDLSGTGVLAIFPQELENRHNIFLEFNLPEVNVTVQCVGRVVRTKRIRKSRYQVALHFDHITRKNRDAIITACLQEQRRQLRERMESG